MRPIIINGESLVYEELYGVQRNTLELLNELDDIIPQGSVKLLVPSESERNFSFRNIEAVAHPKFKGVFGRQLWNHFTFPRYVKSVKGIGVDLTLALPLWGCDVVEIHDCISEDYPENANTIRKKIARRFYMFRAKRAIARGALIITISNFSRQQIAKHYDLKEKTIPVIPCAWQHFQRIRTDNSVIEKYKLTTGKYYFALGSRYAHKNFKWIVEAARQNPNDTFVITGSSSLSSSDKELEATGLKNLLFTGYISDPEVKGLMKHCKAYLQPSLCEGFGIPPMEAMSTGAECIVAKSGSLPEIYADSVRYINPNEYQNINLDEIMKTPVASNETVLSKYSWAKSAQLLWAILNNRALNKQ